MRLAQSAISASVEAVVVVVVVVSDFAASLAHFVNSLEVEVRLKVNKRILIDFQSPV